MAESYAPGGAFLLCRGGRRHRARGVARRAQRAGDGGPAETDGPAVPDTRPGQGGRRLSRAQRALRRRQRPAHHLRRRASRHRDPDAGRADGSGGPARRDAWPLRGGARDAPGERSGAQRNGAARGTLRVDHHADLARRARRNCFDADRQPPRSGDRRRQPDRGEAGLARRRLCAAQDDEPVLVLRSPGDRRLWRGELHPARPRADRSPSVAVHRGADDCHTRARGIQQRGSARGASAEAAPGPRFRGATTNGRE